MKLSSEQKKKRKEERRLNRSLFTTRMVDEFKKVMVIYATLFVTGFLVWEHIIYAKGVTPAFPSAVTIALISGYFTVIVAYCFAAYAEKDSLNKNGLTKGKDGTIMKVVDTIVNTVVDATDNDTPEG